MADQDQARDDSELGRNSGVASGQHQGLRKPSDDGRTRNALHNEDLATRGEQLENHMRDRHSKGVAGNYDDSIDHAADVAAAPAPGKRA